MALDPETVDALADAYGETQPLAAVEDEHRELLPRSFAAGDYGWRDAEWVVQWYFRRFLGAYPDADRRAREDAFRENDYETVHAAITGAAEAETTAAKLGALRDLGGVDLPIASAFLHFLDPGDFVPVSPAEWDVLRAAGELDGPYPDRPAAAAYGRYRDACRAIAERCDRDLPTVYAAIWQRWYEDRGDVEPVG